MTHDPSWDDPAISTTDQDLEAPGKATSQGAGRFEEADVLGAGAGGRIVRGIDNELGRDVALKIADASRPEALRRLLREARVLAALDHPGIVPLYDLAWRDDGGLQLALRIVRGETLGALMRAANRPPLDALLDALEAAADAVGYAHERGYVHRDLKPDNIMVGERAEVQVIDWGLATAGPRGHRVDVTDRMAPLDEPTLTHAGAVLGTPRYMSPEQAFGEAVDTRADVWALGAMLYEVVSGAPLFPQATSSEVLSALRDERVCEHLQRVTAALGARLARVLRQALAPVDARLTDGAAFLHALRKARARRQRWPVAIAVLALVGGVALAAWPRPEPSAQLTSESDVRDAARMRADAALQLWREGSIPEAELMAADSLAMAHSPEALGVIAASRDAVRPKANVISATLPTCSSVDVSADGRRWLCRSADALAVYDVSEPSRVTPAWNKVMKTQAAFFVGRRVIAFTSGIDGADAGLPSALDATYLDDAGRVVATTRSDACLDAKARSTQGSELVVVSGRRCLTLFDDAGGRPAPIWPLMQHLRVGVMGRQLAILDATGMLREAQVPDASDGRIDLGSRTVALDPARVSAVLPLGETRAAMGTQDGALLLVDEAGEVLRASLGSKAAVTALLTSRSARILVVTRERGGPVTVDARTGRVIAQLPRHDLGAMVLVDEGRLVTLSSRLVRWELPAGGPSSLYGYEDAIALATNGRHLAVSHGPNLTWLDTHSWREEWRIIAPSFIKSIALASTPDVSLAFVGVDETLATHLDPETGAQLEMDTTLCRLLDEAPQGSRLTMARRVMFTPSSAVVVAPYEAPAQIASAPGAPFHPLGSDEVIDLSQHGEHMALLTARRDLVLLNVGTAPVELARCASEGAVAVALAPAADRLIAALKHDVIALDPVDCALRQRFELGRHRVSATKVAISPDGRLVAGGMRDGRVFVWSEDGTLLLVLPPHDKLVSALAFDPQMSFLATTAWSGRVDLVDLIGLEALRQTPSKAISAAIHEAYAL